MKVKRLTVYYESKPAFENQEPEYSWVEVDAQGFTRPHGTQDYILVNGAAVRLPGPIVDIRARTITQPVREIGQPCKRADLHPYQCSCVGKPGNDA